MSLKCLLISSVFSAFSLQVGNSLSCISCDSQVDSWCPYMDKTASRQCPIEQSCVTITHSNGGVFRGCLYDNNLQCAGAKSCDICDTDLCNSDQPIPTSCIVCDSTIQSVGCDSAVDMSFSRECPKSIEARIGCYNMVNPDNKMTERGCLATLLEPEKLSKCQKGDNCKICQGDNCNKKGESDNFSNLFLIALLKILLESFQRCITCNSIEDLDCLFNPSDEYSQLCSDYLDVCTSLMNRKLF